MDEERRRLALGFGFVAFGLAAVAQAVAASEMRTWSVAWWATLVGGSASAVAGAFATRHPGWVGDGGGDARPVAFWTAVAGVLLYLAGTVLVFL